MKAKSRITKIEREIQVHNRIPNSEGFLVFYPYETEQGKELKLEKRLKELREKYGDDVSRADVPIMKVVYDKIPITNDLAFKGMKRTSRHMEKQNVTEVCKTLSELSDEQLKEIIGDEMMGVFAKLTDEQLKEIVKTGRMPNDI